MMNNLIVTFGKSLKSCFGQYENSNVSWHCLGCLFRKECELCLKQNEEGGSLQCKDLVKMSTI